MKTAFSKSSRRWFLTAGLVTCLSATAGVSSSWAFSSKDGVEVDLEFEGKVGIPKPHWVLASAEGPAHLETLTNDEQVAAQLTFLSGAFQNNPIQGGRRTDDAYEITGQDQDLIYYHYQGKALLDSSVGSFYAFTLPRDPTTVYQASINTVGTHDGKIPCTDPNYQGEDGYFYFWNPTAPGCRLKKDQDYFEIFAKTKAPAPGPRTYPDYSRLIDKNGEITIHVLMGKNEDQGIRKPLFKLDESAPTFRQYDALLRKEKFSAKTLSKSEILDLMNAIPADKKIWYDKLPYIREYSKVENGVTVRVRYFYGNVGAGKDSSPLHYFWKEALQNASVAIYSGHSGLGSNLKLKMIEDELGPIQVDPDRYQIWVMDGCSTYTYYQQPYFSLKARNMKPGIDPKTNLQIVSAALESAIAYNAATPIEMTHAILAYLRHKDAPDWKTLASSMSHENLLAVSGDELAPNTVDGRYLYNYEPTRDCSSTHSACLGSNAAFPIEAR